MDMRRVDPSLMKGPKPQALTVVQRRDLIREASRDRRLPPSALHVLIEIDGHYGEDKGYCWPSHQRIARLQGMSRTSVARTIPLLERLRYIEVERRPRGDNPHGHSNLYRLLSPEARERPVHATGDVADDAVYKDDEEPDVLDSRLQPRQPTSSAEDDTIYSAQSGTRVVSAPALLSALERTSPSAENSTQNPVIVNPVKKNSVNKNPDREPGNQPPAVIARLERGTSGRKTRWEPDFPVTEAMRTWADSIGVPRDKIDFETEHFLDIQRANGIEREDWDAGWHDHMRRAAGVLFKHRREQALANSPQRSYSRGKNPRGAREARFVDGKDW